MIISEQTITTIWFPNNWRASAAAVVKVTNIDKAVVRQELQIWVRNSRVLALTWAHAGTFLELAGRKCPEQHLQTFAFSPPENVGTMSGLQCMCESSLNEFFTYSTADPWNS